MTGLPDYWVGKAKTGVTVERSIKEGLYGRRGEHETIAAAQFGWLGMIGSFLEFEQHQSR